MASALTCALVTITTTVLHMSRLQALRECEYTRKTRTCTCYSIETGSLQDDAGIDESKFCILYYVRGAGKIDCRAVSGLSKNVHGSLLFQ